MSGSDYWQMVVLFVLLHVLCYDLWFYGVHRLLHLPYFYTRFHWQHHAHRHPTWQHTFDAHWLENGASGLGLFLPCALFGLDPVALALAWLACLCRGVARHDPHLPFSRHHLTHHQTVTCNYSARYIDYIFNTLK